MTNVNILATSRRTLMAGSAWAVPAIVVASAAPAMAASMCKARAITTNWDDTTRYTWTDQYGSSYKTPATATSPASTITFKTVEYGDERVGDPTKGIVTNLKIDTNQSGFASAVWIEMTEVNANGTANLTNRAGSYDNRIEVTVTFDKPVTGLSFSLGDIDQSNDFTDAVALSAVGGTLTGTQVNSYLIGSGTTADPWTPVKANGTVSDEATATSTKGNVNVASTGAISSFTIIYWNRRTENGTNPTRQKVYLSNLTYTTTC